MLKIFFLLTLSQVPQIQEKVATRRDVRFLSPHNLFGDSRRRVAESEKKFQQKFYACSKKVLGVRDLIIFLSSQYFSKTLVILTEVQFLEHA